MGTLRIILDGEVQKEIAGFPFLRATAFLVNHLTETASPDHLAEVILDWSWTAWSAGADEKPEPDRFLVCTSPDEYEWDPR